MVPDGGASGGDQGDRREGEGGPRAAGESLRPVGTTNVRASVRRVDLVAEPPGRFPRVFGATQGGTDGDAARAGAEHRVHVLKIDSADREGRKGDLADDLAEVVESGEGLEGLGRAGTQRADADVTGGVEDRLAGLFDRVC